VFNIQAESFKIHFFFLTSLKIKKGTRKAHLQSLGKKRNERDVDKTIEAFN
jgi:hypothetical protein